MAQKKAETGLTIEAIDLHELRCTVIGQTGLFHHAMSHKAKATLLIGGGKKTAAQKKQVKHNPRQEFLDTLYTHDDPETALCMPAVAFKAAMATAALETAGVTKTAVQRLIFMPQETVPVWGLPTLRCSVVRSADMAKTPDIRTRAYIDTWVAEVVIRYTRPTLSSRDTLQLLNNAGAIVGVGDFRQEKGRGNFGTFYALPTDALPNDVAAHVARMKATAGRAAQLAAIEAAEPFDAETVKLLSIADEAIANSK